MNATELIALGYRKLASSDVGKTFGNDLETTVYIASDIDFWMGGYSQYITVLTFNNGTNTFYAKINTDGSDESYLVVNDVRVALYNMDGPNNYSESFTISSGYEITQYLQIKNYYSQSVDLLYVKDIETTSISDTYKKMCMCINDNFRSKVIILATGVTLNYSTKDVDIDSTFTLTATVAPANTTDKTISWSSSDTAKATVNSSGLVTGKVAGSVTITATTSNGKTATCAVTVKSGVVSVTSVSITSYPTNLYRLNNYQLAWEVLPANAQNKNVTFNLKIPNVLLNLNGGDAGKDIGGGNYIEITTGGKIIYGSSSGCTDMLANDSGTVTITTVDGGFTSSKAITIRRYFCD